VEADDVLVQRETAGGAPALLWCGESWGMVGIRGWNSLVVAADVAAVTSLEMPTVLTNSLLAFAYDCVISFFFFY
jgi:hypothetical protein